MTAATVPETATSSSTGAIASPPPGDLVWNEGNEGLILQAAGAWTFDHIAQLERRRADLLAQAQRLSLGTIKLNADGVQQMDTAGAWLLNGLEQQLTTLGWTVDLNLNDRRYQKLLSEVKRVSFKAPVEPVPPNSLVRLLNSLGKATCDSVIQGARLLSFFGQTVAALVQSLLHPRRLRVTSLTHHLEQTCLNALPIVGLIAFLIGVVMAYQGADQLKRFGAEIFTVDLVAVSILREIGILLTAIVVAGRSGSAFTAEIGSMVVNQEVDALRTLGLDPIEVLVLPRMIALMIALPLLAFVADILGLVGGGLMAWFVLDITPGQFMTQLESAIVPATFWVGIIKAPVFAFLIALVGCYQGLLVSGSADSVGRHTTSSVVISIFLVIVFDALFSILFSALGV